MNEERRLAVLARLGTEIARVLDRDQLCRSIVRMLREECGFERVGLWLFDETRTALVLAVSEGYGSGFDRGLVPIDRGINGWAFRNREPRLAPDLRADPEHLDGPPDSRSELAVPLVSHARPLGTIDVQSTGRPLGEEDLDLVAALAPSFAAAVEVAILHEQLREAALTDSLTGLANSRGFGHTLNREVARARRHGETFCVAMLDVDGLEVINDSDGHLAGDAALRGVGTTLRRLLRAADVGARYGGDEFVILLPHTARAQAEQTLRRIRESCGVPISYGIAEHPVDGADPAALVASAERQLLAAKRHRA